MIKTILASVAHNPHYLNKYITFITNCQIQNESYKGYTEKHHICPKAQDMFPEFTSFSEFPWNCAKLTPRQHFIAHLMLHKAYPKVVSQSQALYLMINVMGIKNNSKLYANLKEIKKNTVVVKDTSGHIFLVSNIDPRYLSGELVHITTGKVTVKDDEGNTFQVDKTDTRFLSGELVNINKGKVSVRDALGNTFQVDKTDPRYLSGDLLGVIKGKVNVRDTKGDNFQVAADDPRFLSGDLVGIAKGRVSVRDALGNTFQVDKTDPRYLAGELVHIFTGKVAVKNVEGTTFQVAADDPRFLSGDLVGIAKGRVSDTRVLTEEQVREIRLAIKDPTGAITNKFIASVVKQTQEGKVGSIPFEELKYKNGHPLTYKTLLVKYFVDKFKRDRKTITNIIDGKTYKEITV